MRSHLLLPLAVALAVAPCAHAEDCLEAQGAAHVSLTRHELVGEADSELDVDATVLRAKHGLRLEADADFAPSSPLAVDEIYLVRDAAGEAHRVRISVPEAGRVRVALLGSEAKPRILAGTFRNVSASLNGRSVRSVFPPLIVLPDGRYKQGQATGRWTVADGRLRLSDGLASWGAGLVADDGRGVTFTWSRGLVTWEVTFERADDPPQVAATATRR